jgi:tetratricopeptide (TPR) repeat protein
VALDYLSEPEVGAYLAQRFGGTRLAGDLARLLHRRTTGNPLFLIALVDELVRQQVVQAGPEGWEVRRGVEAITATVPATLRALTEVQLARLSPADQTLLEAASIAGVECAAAAVAAALGRAEAVVEARCASLAQQGQFLQARGRAEWPDGTVTACYGFRHAVYQEVLYERIPAGRQTRWHARMGTRLAQGFREGAKEMAAALARHFVRGRLLPQAVHYLRQAGQQAAQRGAYREAVAFYEQALPALQRLPTTPETLAQAIDLRLDLRYVLVLLGDLGKVLQCLHEAETLAAHLHDHRRQGRVTAYLSYSCWLAGDYDRATESGQRALRMAGDDVAVQVRAQLALGHAHQNTGDYHHAIACFRQAAEPLKGQQICEDLGVAGLRLINIGAWEVCGLAELGAFVEGHRRGERGVRMAEAGDDRGDRTAAWFGLGRLHLRQGDLRQAIPALGRGLSLCQEGNLPIWLTPLASALGYAYTLAGRVSEGLPLLERAVAWDTSRGVMAGHALHLAWLSEAYLRGGRLEEAVTHAGRALERSLQYKERGHEAWTRRLLGETASHQAPPAVEPAEEFYRQALALAEALGMRPLQAHCHLGLGQLYATIGRRAEARAELSTAIALYRAMDMTFWLPQAEAALAQVEGW